MNDRTTTIRNNLDRVCLLEWVERQCRGVTFEELIGPSHAPRITSLRHEVWSLIHGTLGFSHCEIARLFCVDHTTVRSAVTRRERMIARAA